MIRAICLAVALMLPMKLVAANGDEKVYPVRDRLEVVSLDGTWTASQSFNEKRDTADVSMKISLEGSETFIISGSSFTSIEKAIVNIAAAHEGEDMTMGATVTGKISGTVTREGDVLTFTPAKKAKPEITVETENIPGILKAMLITPIKSEMNKSLKETDRARIISLSDNEMVLEEILTEKEIKKGTKPERTTFKKK